ncbi:MAG: NADH-quinone oxidoreductase subunit E [Anaerolineae bacterium]|nr:NADH-quinone oxidoreductase subunit E [Anaerolineae bacterium]
MDDPKLMDLQTKLDEFAPTGRSALLPALHHTQKLFGYIPQAAASRIAASLHIPLANVHGVIDFYTLFYRQPVAETVIHVCNDPVCAFAGSDSLFKNFYREVPHQAASGGLETIALERSPCLGLCEHAPALLVQGMATAGAAGQSWQDIITGNFGRPHTQITREVDILTSNCGKGAPTWLAAYEASGGYQAFRKALGMSPAEVISQVKASGLVGRGGAAFPTGVKWEGAANAPGSPKYVVCNADEAEPGTFKDRVMMESDPHRILEGMLIAAYAIGANKGYMYIRGEYIHQFEVMAQARQEAMTVGYIGERVLGSDFSFDLELRLGAGAYVCGEETALFESIEGKRGLPRIKPPFPITHGLFGKPTVINNVETLANVPYILSNGAEAYRKIGTERSPGPKLFCLSGDVEKPGLYEVPFGVTFRHVLYDLAGGVRGGRKMQATLFGGAAGAFATEKDLDVRLSFEDLKAAGLPLGSGVIMVFDDSRDLKQILLRLARFFAEESCGKCFPCQIGTQRQLEILQNIASYGTSAGDREQLEDVARTMTDASICGLGQTAGSAVMSAIQQWQDLFKPARERKE